MSKIEHLCWCPLAEESIAMSLGAECQALDSARKKSVTHLMTAGFVIRLGQRMPPT